MSDVSHLSLLDKALLDLAATQEGGMGFMIVSEALLSRQELLKAIADAQVGGAPVVDGQPVNLRVVNMYPNNTSDAGDQYYVRLMRQYPFEYVVFTIDEVINLLRAKTQFEGTHASLCSLLRHAMIPFADDDDEEEMEEDDDDVD